MTFTNVGILLVVNSTILTLLFITIVRNRMEGSFLKIRFIMGSCLKGHLRIGAVLE